MKNTHVVVGDKERILMAVLAGRMSREDAERIASEKGIVLQSEPRSEDFDPMTESAWSLSMAITWIAWRDPSKVRQVWTDYLAKCVRWHKLNAGAQIEIADPDLYYEIKNEQPRIARCINEPEAMRITSKSVYVTAFSYRWKLDFLDPVLPSALASFWNSEGEAESDIEARIEDARRALWERLSNSDLTGTAINLETGQPCEIPAREWSYLRCPVQTDGVDLLRLEGGSTEYRDLRLRRDDVWRLWPDSSDPCEPAPSAHLKAGPAAKKTKPGPKIKRAREAIIDRYGEIPDLTDPPNALLLMEVGALLQDRYPKYPIGNDTILRAACRKK